MLEPDEGSKKETEAIGRILHNLRPGLSKEVRPTAVALMQQAYRAGASVTYPVVEPDSNKGCVAYTHAEYNGQGPDCAADVGGFPDDDWCESCKAFYEVSLIAKPSASEGTT